MNIEKIFPPTRYDKAPYRQIVRVKDEEGAGEDFYIQLSEDEENPYWALLGEFFVVVFKDRLMDEMFIDECIKKYHGHS